MPKRNEIHINVFYPTAPHKGQQEVLDALDKGERFILLRAGRKWRKTSLIISWLFENAFKTGLVCPYIAPNRVLAKDIAWDDHVRRMMGQSQEDYPPMHTMLYLYVDDVDTVYSQVLEAGGESLRKPREETYGDRTAGIWDKFGNQWWIATPLQKE